MSPSKLRCFDCTLYPPPVQVLPPSSHSRDFKEVEESVEAESITSSNLVTGECEERIFLIVAKRCLENDMTYEERVSTVLRVRHPYRSWKTRPGSPSAWSEPVRNDVESADEDKKDKRENNGRVLLAKMKRKLCSRRWQAGSDPGASSHLTAQDFIRRTLLPFSKSVKHEKDRNKAKLIKPMTMRRHSAIQGQGQGTVAHHTSNKHNPNKVAPLPLPRRNSYTVTTRESPSKCILPPKPANPKFLYPKTSLQHWGLRLPLSNQSTIPHHISTLPPHSTTWSTIPASTFSVRSGPHYPVNKFKAPSLDSLYDVFAVRCFRSFKRTKQIANVLPMPEEAFEIGKVGNGAPQVLLVCFQLPFEPPSVFKSKDDGVGSEIVFYLKPSPKFLRELTSTTKSAATSLFLNWCDTAPRDFKMRSRFKCLASVRNMEQHNLGWLKPYNAKPVLITESGSARRGKVDGIEFLEMNVNVHSWTFLAKKGFVSLLPKFKTMQIDVGFTIEAWMEKEMPECVLGCAGMNYVDETSFLSIPEDMQTSWR